MPVTRKAYKSKCGTTYEVSNNAAVWMELARQIFLNDLAKTCHKIVAKKDGKGKKTLRRRDVVRAYKNRLCSVYYDEEQS